MFNKKNIFGSILVGLIFYILPSVPILLSIITSVLAEHVQAVYLLPFGVVGSLFIYYLLKRIRRLSLKIKEQEFIIKDQTNSLNGFWNVELTRSSKRNKEIDALIKY